MNQLLSTHMATVKRELGIDDESSLYCPRRKQPFLPFGLGKDTLLVSTPIS